MTLEGVMQEGDGIGRLKRRIDGGERAGRGSACGARSRGARGYVYVDGMYIRVFDREPMEDYQKRALQT